MNYWNECIKEAFEEAGIVATTEQIETVVNWVEGAHENYGLATGSDFIFNSLREELDKTKRELEKERDKRTCEACGGRGSLEHLGPVHSAISFCYKCHGEGKY